VSSVAGRTFAVTGATGFVGRALARRLLDEGAGVRVLARRGEAAADLADRGASVVVGDLSDAAALGDLCDGANVVLHSAALAGDVGTVADFVAPNVDGTVALAHAARAAGCTRLVYLSTVSVYGFDPPPLADETTPAPELGDAYPYAHSKRLGEIALEAIDIERVVARVGSVYGPGSEHWTARPVRVMNSGTGMVLVEGGRGLHNYVYIDNLVDALVLCAVHPDAPGHTFNLTDGATTYADFFGRYIAMADGPRKTRKLSRRQAMAVAWAAEKIAALRGRPPLLTRLAIRLLLRRSEFSNARARRVLGWHSRVSLEDGMTECDVWLRDSGLL